jgi:hypothetical protein
MVAAVASNVCDTCGKKAIGTTEDGVRVCCECAEAKERGDIRVDYDPPDLITTSGRERMPLAERVGLLEADAVYLASIRPQPIRGRISLANGRTVHDINVTIGFARAIGFRYRQLADHARARAAVLEALEAAAKRLSAAHSVHHQTAPAAKALLDLADACSQVECDVLAWRRGGFEEYQRVRAAQRAQKSRR